MLTCGSSADNVPHTNKRRPVAFSIVWMSQAGSGLCVCVCYDLLIFSPKRRQFDFSVALTGVTADGVSPCKNTSVLSLSVSLSLSQIALLGMVIFE